MSAIVNTKQETILNLAPQHKRGLPLKSPLLAATGCWGFANEYAKLIDISLLGALITNPISWHPRQPSRGGHTLPLTSGIALHTGLPNPGFRAALQQFGQKWRKMVCPIIVHLVLDDADQARKCVEQLEDVDNVLAIELGFHHKEDSRAAAAIIATAAQGLLPVVVQSPFSRTSEFTTIAEEAGAQAITVSAPPRAAMQSGDGEVWSGGRLYGSAMFAHTLQVVRELHHETSLPIIASGSIHSTAETKALHSAGAQAMQLQSVVWINPLKVNAMLQSWKS